MDVDLHDEKLCLYTSNTIVFVGVAVFIASRVLTLFLFMATEPNATTRIRLPLYYSRTSFHVPFFLNHMEKYKTKTNALIGCYYVTEQSNDQ